MKTFTLAIRITTVVTLSLLMVQCGNKQAAPNQSVSDDTTISSYRDKLPIAYINVDSLLSKYNYAKDLNEKMINKQENARASINEKARQLKKEQDDFQRKYQNNAFQKAAALDKEQKEFQKKYENNAFISPERAQQEYQRLEKKAADLQEYAQRLENENMLEQQKMLMQMNDSINLFIKEYNKEKKYEAIFNNASTLYINPQYDITNEVVELLNKRYTSAKK